jgi:dTDP-4-dehydrorhamnose 3,5-epimerase-like enzyme
MIKAKLSSVDDVSKFAIASHSMDNSSLRIYDDVYRAGAIRSFLISSKCNEIRGNHAHISSRQWFTAVQGQIAIEVYDGKDTKTLFLENGIDVLLIPAGLWSRQIYSENSILLVFTDTQYAEKDYIREVVQFEKWKTR